MSFDENLYAWVQEALEPLGSVTMRRMMGGAMLYLDGTVFGILDEGEVWFKSDAESDAAWDAAGAERFTYSMGDGRTGSMNYRRAPTDAYDDPDACGFGRGSASKQASGEPRRRRARGKRRPSEPLRTPAALPGVSSIDRRKRGSIRFCDACS
jgi:DNA transformation protein